MSKAALLIAVLLALVLASSAGAKPKPERPNGKRIHWVSFSYTYRTTMVATIDGYLVTVPLLCHVPAHAKSWCEVAP